VVLGLYYMTRERIAEPGEGMMFADVEEVHRAYENHIVGLHAKIKVRIRETNLSGERSRRLVTTTAGRALLSEIVPAGLSFDLINRAMNKRAISGIINACHRELGLKETAVFADQLLHAGLYFAPKSGGPSGPD